MIKCSHGAHALNIHVHVTHQCGMHKNLWCGVCTCILVWIRACVPVSLADSSGRLEIKTLCGTWLVIRWELKQKAEESTGKKKGEQRGAKSNGESGRGRSVLSERGRRERVPLLQSYSLCLGCLFIRMSDRPFPVGSPLSVVCLNVNEIGENRWRQRNRWVTSKRIAGERTCAHNHIKTHTRSLSLFISPALTQVVTWVVLPLAKIVSHHSPSFKSQLVFSLHALTSTSLRTLASPQGD